jgi:hypothetical protein
MTVVLFTTARLVSPTGVVQFNTSTWLSNIPDVSIGGLPPTNDLSTALHVVLMETLPDDDLYLYTLKYVRYLEFAS